MAETLGVSTDSTNLTTAVTPQQGVADTSGAQATVNLAAGVKAAGETVAGIAQVFSENKKKGVLASFSLEQLKLFDALAQNKITRKEALTKSRVNVASFIADNPGQAEKIIELQGKLVTKAGLGKVISEQSAQDQREQDFADKAFAAGFRNPDGTPDTESFRTLMALEANAKDLKAEKEDLIRDQTFEKNKLGIAASQINLRETQLKVRGEKLVVDLVGNQRKSITSRLEGLFKQVSGGAVDANQAAATIAELEAGIQQRVNEFAADTGTDFANNAAKPLFNIIQTYKEIIAGGKITEALGNQLKRAEMETFLNMVDKDPSILRFKAVSAIFKNIPLGLLDKAQALMIQVMEKTSKLQDDGGGQGGAAAEEKQKPRGGHNFADPETEKESRDWFTIIKSVLTQDQPSASVPLRIQSIGQMEGLLRSIDVFQANVDKTTDYQNIVKFLSDPGIGKYLVNNPIDPDLLSKAGQVIKAEYNDNLLPLVREKWLKSFARTGSGTETVFKPTRNTFVPVFDGAGVVFQLAEGVKLDPEGKVADSLKNLNDSVGTLLNQMIRLDAHLSGTQNYKQVWERSFVKLFTPTEANEDGTKKE